jgi:hypothetical protein
MDKNNNRTLLIVAVSALVLVCVCVVVIAGVGVLIYQRGVGNGVFGQVATPILEEIPVTVEPRLPTEAVTEQPVNTPQAEVSPTQAESPVVEPPGDIPAETLETMQTIEDQVVEIRGLLPDESEFFRVLLSPTQLAERVKNDFLQDYTPEDARKDAVVLALFGLLEPDFDMLSFYQALLSEQIAGFYDDETKEMVVIQGNRFGGPEKTTYAHEFTHALQDQNFKIKEGLGFDDERCEEDTERCAAIQALLEGDATLTEENWLINYSSFRDKQELLEFYNSYESPIFESSPAFMQEDFLFPYLQGRTFVQHYFDLSGWQGINDLYQNPPVSTEQILHPENYPADTPMPVNLPDLTAVLGDGWEEVDRNVLGEWYTFLMLARAEEPETRLEDDRATSAAAGWGGDTYLVYSHTDNPASILIYQSVWDTQQDADEFAEAFVDYGELRFGPAPATPQSGTWIWQSAEGYVWFSYDRQSGVTRWIIAPDETTARLVLDNLASP